MDLSQVSRTAILLLICRVVESEKHGSEFTDPMAVFCLDRLMSFASEEEKDWIIRKKKMYAGFHERDAESGTRRAMAFDNIANRFITLNPTCTVINLACGFDTRFWRIDHHNCRYVEIDLPEVIALKKEVLKDRMDYELLGYSVLDTAWIDKVTTNGNTGFLLIAEGLFMWFPEQEAARIFREIGNKFYRSQLVLDMVSRLWTRGIWKSMMRLHSRIEWGLDVSWTFGINDPIDLGSFSSGFKVIGKEKGSAGPIITIAVNGGQG